MHSVGIIANYNLDSAVASILVDRFYGNVQQFKSGGRNKLPAMLDYMIGNKIRKLFIIGFTPTADMVRKMVSNGVETEIFESAETRPDLNRHFDSHGKMIHYIAGKPVSVSVASSMMNYLAKNNRQSLFTEQFSEMVLASTAYTQWKVEDPKFKLGHALDALFFYCNMWGFREEFWNGLNPKTKISSSYLSILDKIYKERDRLILSNPHQLVGKGSVLFMTNGKYLNDYALTIPGYTSYHMLRRDLEAQAWRLSSRIPYANRNDGYDLKTAYHKTMEKKHNIQFTTCETGFGSKDAFGINFDKSRGFDDIRNFVDEYATAIEQK